MKTIRYIFSLCITQCNHDFKEITIITDNNNIIIIIFIFITRANHSPVTIATARVVDDSKLYGPVLLLSLRGSSMGFMITLWGSETLKLMVSQGRTKVDNICVCTRGTSLLEPLKARGIIQMNLNNLRGIIQTNLKRLYLNCTS